MKNLINSIEKSLLVRLESFYAAWSHSWYIRSNQYEKDAIAEANSPQPF
jgi:hypothetical protein